MFIVLSLLILLAVMGISAYNKITAAKCKTSRHLVGKVVIVTGGNIGIGYETAKDLAERGARVLLACRDEGRGVAARDKLVEATGNRDVHYRHLDLASLASVRAFADNILKTEQRLDILINNAGVCGSKYKITEDGLLFEMQINHFGPFLLTNLLLPLLKSAAPSRIVNVSSIVHLTGRVQLDNLNMEKQKRNTTCYKTYRNNRRRRCANNDLLCRCSRACYNQLSGRYFSDCREVKPSKLAQNKELARKLWDESEKLVKLN